MRYSWKEECRLKQTPFKKMKTCNMIQLKDARVSCINSITEIGEMFDFNLELLEKMQVWGEQLIQNNCVLNLMMWTSMKIAIPQKSDGGLITHGWWEWYLYVRNVIYDIWFNYVTNMYILYVLHQKECGWASSGRKLDSYCHCALWSKKAPSELSEKRCLA